MDTSIYSAINNDGVEAHVFETRKGSRFEVRVLDAEAGEWVYGQTEFVDFNAACIYAALCVR